MRVLIIDEENSMLSVAWRATLSGHEVRWFAGLTDTESGEGFGIQKISNFVPSLKWADLILASKSRYTDRLTVYKQQGLPYFGPTTVSEKLEISPEAQLILFDESGLDICPYTVFESPQEAIQHVEETGKAFIVKTQDSLNLYSKTYPSSSAADLLAWLEKNQDMLRGRIILQDYEEGILMSVSRFMGKKGFIGPWIESFEYNKLSSYGSSPNLEEMKISGLGAVACFTEESKLGQETLSRLEKHLSYIGHTGNVTLHCLIPEDGKPKSLKLVTRWRWPFLSIILNATEKDPVAWMKDALSGKDSISFRKEIGSCFSLLHTPDEMPPDSIYGTTKSNKKYICPRFVKIETMPDMDKGNIVRRPVWIATDQSVLSATGFGKNITQSTNRALKTINQLHLANSIVRKDIGEDLKEIIPMLHRMGFAKNFTY